MAPDDAAAYLAEVRLQWGHGREAMDGGGPSKVDWGDDELQWGHGREAMDGRVRSDDEA